MHKWLQKEFFFVGMLCFIFISTASTATFVKRYLHHNFEEVSTVLVIWPERQAAIYPKKPAPKPSNQPSASATAKAATPKKSTVRKTYAPQYRKRVVTTYPRKKRVQRKKRYRAAYYKKKATPLVKKASTQPPQKTVAQRNYESDMAWVRKTLKSYQDR